jgi:predicted transcriptional regulator
VIEQLFGSKTRVKLLHLFYTNPNRSFYVREITRKVNEQINSVRRELSNLLNIGIIKSDTSGNRLYYEIDQAYKHYEQLRSIFTTINTKKEKQTLDTDRDVVQKLSGIGSVDLVLLSGHFVRSETSPVDILIVGDINRPKLMKLISELEAQEGKEMRFTVLKKDEFIYRMNLKDKFLSTIFSEKYTIIAGSKEISSKQIALAK